MHTQTFKYVNTNTETEQKHLSKVLTSNWIPDSCSPRTAPAPICQFRERPIGCEWKIGKCLSSLSKFFKIRNSKCFLSLEIIEKCAFSSFYSRNMAYEKGRHYRTALESLKFLVEDVPKQAPFFPLTRDKALSARAPCLTNSKQNDCDQWCSASFGKTGARVQLHIWE